MNTITLTDGIISLRAPEPADIDDIFRWENDTDSWIYGNQSAPYSRKNIEDYVVNYDADIFSARQLRFVITLCDGNEKVGAIDLFDFDPVNERAAVGIIIDSRFRKIGYATRALQLLIEFCRQRLGLHQLWAIVARENIPSRRLFEKAGFNISGCLRSWIRFGSLYTDAYLLQKLLP